MRPYALPLLITSLGLVACEADKATKAPATSAKAAKATPASGPASSPHGAIGGEKAPPGQPFSGLVKLAEGLTEADLKATDVLFIMARESQGGGLAGRLVAVQRLGKSEYPLRYEMGAKDVMVPGIPFSGPFIVTARLDRDGDPMTRGDDDLYATFPKEVLAGQEGVHLVLKKGAPKVIKAPQGVRPPPSGGSVPSSQAAH